MDLPYPALRPAGGIERRLESVAHSVPMISETVVRPNCALFYGADGFRVDRKAVKGRHSAGAGFLKGLLEHGGVDRLIALTGSRGDFADFRALVGELDELRRPVVQADALDGRTPASKLATLSQSITTGCGPSRR